MWGMKGVLHQTFWKIRRVSNEGNTGVLWNQTEGFHVLKEKCYLHFFLNTAALELLNEAIAKAGYTEEVVIGMDVAASEFYRDGKYDLDFKSPDDSSRYITPDELADLYKSFIKDYPGIFLLIFVYNMHFLPLGRETTR